MIGALLRLVALYVLVWFIGTQWDGGAFYFQRAVDQLLHWQSALPAMPAVPGTAMVFAAFGAAALAWHIAGLWCWLLWVPVDVSSGPTRHPFAPQSLALRLRIRPGRTTFLLVLTLLGLMFALRTTQVLDFTALGAEPLKPALLMAPAILGPWLELNAQQGVWFSYIAIHIAAGLTGWILMWASAAAAARFAQRLESSLLSTNYGGFAAYQRRRLPAAQLFILVVAFGHLPLAALSATSHPHPLHALVTIASLTGVLGIAIAGHLASLWVELRHDRWLRELALEARAGGPASPEYLAWENTVRFLTGRRPHSAESPTESTEYGTDDFAEQPDNTHTPAPEKPWPAANHDHDEPQEHDEERRGNGPEPGSITALAAYQVLAEARAQVERGKLRRARRLFEDAASMGDDAVRQQAEHLLATLPGARRRTAVLVFSLGGLMLCVSGVVAWQWFALPNPTETRQLARSAHIHVHKVTTNGKARVDLLGTRYDYSLNTSLANISPHFIAAVVASEDHRFFEHGVAYKVVKFAQAGVQCITNKLLALSRAQACKGNSTLPQQLARNLFLSEKRSIRRKLAELLWALKMETGLSKEEILELYMNRIYLGNGNFGVEMAARDYFNKPASRLTVTESAYLAAAIKRPNWNWHQDRERALLRGQLILALMKKQGLAPSRTTLDASFKPAMGNRQLFKPYLGHLWQWAREEVGPIMADLPDGSYKVLTSLNAEVEVYAERDLRNQVNRLRGKGVPVGQGAVVVMRPDGEVLAMVGGVGNDLTGRGTNRAKRTAGLLPRPPASAFKPFVYLAALESGLTPGSRIDASPVAIPVADSREVYQPQNHDGRTYRDVSMQEGLVHSINTAAVHLLHQRIGFDGLMDTVGRLGISTDGLRRQWGLALGQSGIPLIEMAGAYAVFANGGQRVMPHTVKAVTTEFGKTVWKRPRPAGEQVFDRQHISALNDMLSRVVRVGTGHRARYGLPETAMVAGKTGTGDGFVDAWFIGYTADLVIAVWFGNDRPVEMSGVYGGTGPALTFNAILRNLVKHTDLTSVTDQLP